MLRPRVRLVAGLLASAVVAAASSAAASTGGYALPWFRGVSAPVAGVRLDQPLSLALRYIPFWQYLEGFAWMEYNTTRSVVQSVPPVYAARAATPLPNLAEPITPKLPTQQVAARIQVSRTAPAPAPSPAPSPAPAPGLTAEEQLMVQLVNAERAKVGLAPLEVDFRLVQTARIKSQDMITYNYFSHDSPRLGSPFDQMKSAGVRYMTAGENIAGNQTVEAAHRALMNSAGHRANILKPSFKKIGIGIIRGGRYGLTVTQQFIG